MINGGLEQSDPIPSPEWSLRVSVMCSRKHFGVEAFMIPLSDLCPQSVVGIDGVSRARSGLPLRSKTILLVLKAAQLVNGLRLNSVADFLLFFVDSFSVDGSNSSLLCCRWTSWGLSSSLLYYIVHI